MDVVILAAGRSERLSGIVPPFHKPMLVVGGRSMIGRLVDLSYDMVAGESDRVIVVTAPENTVAISSVIDERSDIVVQRKPTGPLKALIAGLDLVRSERFMVLMADNIVSDSDINGMLSELETEDVIGATFVPADGAVRFTRYDESTGQWVEKEPYRGETPTDEQMVWCGPLIFNTKQLIRTLIAMPKDETLISAVLRRTRMTIVNVSSIDIGIPEALR